MKRTCALLFAVLVAACAKKAPPPAATLAFAGLTGAQERGAAATQADRTLAYEHHVSIELPEAVLPERLDAVRKACVEDSKRACTLLDVSRQDTRGAISGRVRMRLPPNGVEPMVAIAGDGGKVVSRTTHAEDLAQPVADADRQIALLTTHRDRLAEIMKNRDLKVDQLILVSKELATVQTELDAAAAQRANLRRRLDTELLEIELSVEGTQYGGASTPVRDAIRSFTADFANAVGAVISFIAMLLPWLVVALPGIVLLRLFWRWIGRRFVRS
jgi:Domain of unknown function (DUF4349)